MNLRKGFLLSLILVLGFITFLMLEPFSGFILVAIILAFVSYPLYSRLNPYLGAHISAGFVLTLTILLAVIPFLFISLVVIEDATQLSQDLNESDVINVTQAEQFIEDYTGQEVSLNDVSNNLLSGMSDITFGGVSEIFSVVTHFSVGIFFMIFLIFYLLKDGNRLLKWVKAVTPMPTDLQDMMVVRIEKTTWAVVKGHVFVAFIQGAVAGLGLVVTGVPNWGFWTFIMVILAFIPVIGTTLVWGPAAAYLFLIGRPSAAILLAIYGFLIVNLVDNFLRPLIVDRGADLHPAVILVGVVGGLYVFGIAGLFVGPIAIGVFKSSLIVFKNHYDEL
jgi:predicted PurR-regulated permease PerM